MKQAILLVFAILAGYRAGAQTLFGSIKSAKGEPVQGATMMLRHKDSTRVIRYAVSDALGTFRIWKGEGPGYLLVVQHISYETASLTLEQGGPDTVRIELEPRKQQLKEVVVRAQMPVVIRNDTIVFNASSYAAPDVRKVDELLGRMQGFGITADGRITFNGKSVEKVLVDGEDLAGKGYQLLTRNLGAGYVDKVEVITNFSSNRLVGELGKQDAVGVNLRIREKYKGKLTGSVDAAYGGRRYHASGNALSLGKGYKAFAFGDINNVAEDAMGSLSNIPEGEGLPEGSVDGLLSTGRLQPPALHERYRKNNKDAAAATMVSWRTGPRNRMRALAGYAQQLVVNQGLTEVSNQLNDSLAWRVHNEISEENSTGNTFFKLIGQRDDSSSRIDDYFLDLRQERPRGAFSNIASLDLVDSLQEQLHTNSLYAGAGWKATRARKGQKLLQVNNEAYFFRSSERLGFLTERYAGYFGFPASYDNGSQVIELRRLRLSSNVVWLRNSQESGWRYGLSAFFDRSGIRSSTAIAAAGPDSSYAGVGRVESAGSDIDLRRNWYINRKTEFSIGIRAGPRIATSMDASRFFLGGVIGVDYARRFSVLRVFRAKLSLQREVPDLLKDVPAPVLNGNATIMEGMDLSRPLMTANAQASYFSNNIKSQFNWSASLILAASPSSYTGSVMVDPAFTASFIRNERGGYSALLIAGAEKYVSAVKGKLGISMTANLLENRFGLNGETATALNAGAQGETWWISGFRKGVGLESRFRLGRYFSGMSGRDGATVTRSGFSQKLHWRPWPHAFLSMIFNSVQLGSGSWFNGLDLFAQWKFKGRITVHIKGVNLLGARTAREKTVSPYSYSINDFRLVQRYVLFGMSLGLK